MLPVPCTWPRCTPLYSKDPRLQNVGRPETAGPYRGIRSDSSRAELGPAAGSSAHTHTHYTHYTHTSHVLDKPGSGPWCVVCPSSPRVILPGVCMAGEDYRNDCGMHGNDLVL